MIPCIDHKFAYFFAKSIKRQKITLLKAEDLIRPWNRHTKMFPVPLYNRILVTLSVIRTLSKNEEN